MQHISFKQWHRLAVYCGFSAFISYFLAAFAPLPEKISLLFAFAFGPLFMLSSVGLFFVLKHWRDSINLRIAVLFNTVATAMVTMMLVVQVTSQAFHQQFLAAGRGSVSEEQLKWIFKEVNAVQLGMDLAWDIFISIGTFFFALVMFNHPQINKIISILGLIFSVLLLGFNLTYFPEPPSEVGSIDFGPFVAIWYLILFGWLAIQRSNLIKLSSKTETEECKPTTKGILPLCPRAVTFAARSSPADYSVAGFQLCGISSCSWLTL